MQHATATLYCPNCQSDNPEIHEFCQQCHALLPKNYLWASGLGIAAYRVGDLLEGRYLLKSDRVLLDTTPGLLAEQSLISAAVEPYLKLFPYRLHIPQVYGLVASEQSDQEIVLLEASGSWGSLRSGSAVGIGIAVSLVVAWSEATTLRQLNWLWQIAQLWQPLKSQSVASSLLQPELLRVEGSVFRLLELRLDQGSAPTLAQLGELWSQWVPGAQAAIATSLKQLCQQMVQGQIRTAEQLVAQLDQWLVLAGRSHSYPIEIATRTDKGPVRAANEDACYPPDGAVVANPSQALTIVCDGVGGHAGGAVASSLATEALQQHFQAIEIESLDPKTLIAELETATCIANDQISRRNDSEQRQDRQRMGTTLVMALARPPEIYITHVGDSRAYWITGTGCYQITLDDDVASREVRLGYTLYREALAQPASGALVQALGMGSSAILRPTVQRFILDEECVFLLCSDGLSDNDRVEECWDTEILPILEGKTNIATAAQRLVELANRKNGHDNVTISLVHCRVAQAGSASGNVSSETDAQLTASAAPYHLLDSEGDAKTQILKPNPRLTPRLLPVLLLLGVSGLLAYLFVSPLLRPRPLARNSSPENTQSPQVSPPSLVSAQAFTVGARLQINPAASGKPARSAILLSQPDKPEAIKGFLQTGSVLQVLRKQAFSNQRSWLRVKVCSAPPVLSPAPKTSAFTSLGKPPPSLTTSKRGTSTPSLNSTRPLLPGATGWIREADVTLVATALKPDRSSACAASPQVSKGRP